MSRKQMITVTCEYRKPTQDLAYGLPEPFPQRSPPGILPGIPHQYMVHGLPKRLHCRPRIPVTPSKVGENDFRFGKLPTMINGIPTELKMYGDQELSTAWSQLKMKLQCSPEQHETNIPLDTVIGEAHPVCMSELATTGEPHPVCMSETGTAGKAHPVNISETGTAGEAHPGNISETAEIDTCILQSDKCAEEAEANGGENVIRENDSCEHLEGDPVRNPATDTCTGRQSLDEVSSKYITPPNSPNPEPEPAELQPIDMAEYCQEREHSKNEIHVIDESAIYNELDMSDQEPASWYHRLVQLELHNKHLQVPKPENNVKTQMPNLCKFQWPSPHFPPDETSESRRISRTERHVQYLLLKENSIKTREKCKQSVQKPRKPAA